MKWFQVDSDTPNDPKIRCVLRELGPEGIGGLFLLWCHIADHGIRKPGWSIDSFGKAMPEADLMDASKLSEEKFRDLVRVCLSTGHFLKRPWTTRKVIAIPAMNRRADTYTRRQLRSDFEQGAKPVQSNFANKTVHTKTTHSNKEKARRLSPSPVPDSADDNRRVIRALVRDVVNTHPDITAFVDLKDLAKDRCAALQLAYDPETVGAALEQVLARKAKAS